MCVCVYLRNGVFFKVTSNNSMKFGTSVLFREAREETQIQLLLEKEFFSFFFFDKNTRDASSAPSVRGLL